VGSRFGILKKFVYDGRSIPTDRKGAANTHQCTQPNQGHGTGSEKGRDHVACQRRYRRGVTMTSSITNESVDDLGIKTGGKVMVVIKSSDVMIAVD
jgi:molybdopterin-binding protein